MRIRSITALAGIALVLAIVATAAAAPSGPVLQVPGGSTFQAPLGGISFATSGDLGGAGGLTWTYTGVPGVLATLQSLEWGPSATNAIQLNFSGDPNFTDATDTLVYNAGVSNLANGIAVWTGGPINYTALDFGGTLDTRLVLTANDALTGPIHNFISTSGYGDGATVPITGNFSSNLKLEVTPHGGTSWTPYKDFFNAHNNNGNTTQASVTGGFFYTQPSGPIASFSSYDFAVVRFGAHPTHTITVTNTGGGPLTVTGVAITAATLGNFTDFTVDSQTCTTVSPIAIGGTCTVTVGFSPTADGQGNARLTLTDNAGTGSQSSTLNGFGIHGVLSASVPDFGNQMIGSTSAPVLVQITNSGTDNVVIGSITSTGDFALTSNTCSGTTRTPGGLCSVMVTFTPTATGPRTGSIVVASDAFNNPYTIPLTGTGVAPAPVLSVPGSVSFDGQGLGTSSTKSVTVTNAGTAPLHVSSATAGGDFSVASSSCATVATGATCTIVVRFAPSVSGSRSGTLTISSDAGSGTNTVSLSGTGVDGHLALSPSPLAFGNVYTGQSKTLTMTFTNSGPDTVHVTDLGPMTGDTSQLQPNFGSITCSSGGPPVIPAGVPCTITFTFTPSGVGARSASFTFQNDSSDGAQTITLTGTGINPHLAASPSPADLGSHAVGSTSHSDVTITNTGSSALSVTGVSATGDFSADASACVAAVAPGSTCAIHVGFTPSTTGSRTGTLTIQSNASSSPDSVSLSGFGTDPRLAAPASVDFGGVLLGQALTRNVSISSTGTTPLHIQTVALSGPGFTVLSDACSLSTLGSGSSCLISVRFAPTVGGLAGGSLLVRSDAATSPTSILLAGNGLGGTFASTGTGAFGNALDGTTSQSAITVRNIGTGTLDFSAVSIIGPESSSFGVGATSTCSPSTILAVGGTCTLVVLFSPASDGVRHATLRLAGDATNSPYDVDLSGTGISPRLTVNPAGALFGIQTIVGHLTASASTQTMSAQSVGTAPVTISSVSVSGPFVITGDACSHAAAVPAGNSCPVQVAFVPTAIGLAFGTLTFVTDGGIVTVALSGTGVDGNAPTLQNVPANQTVWATSASGAVLPYITPTATDDLDPAPVVTCTPASGATFAVGTTTVTCRASDSSGNVATAAFTVTVNRDTTPPVLSGVPASFSVSATTATGGVATWATPFATDAVDGPVLVTCAPASGSTFPLGATLVTCTATDHSGNAATGTFTVTVVSDTTPPVISGVPGSITVNATRPAGATVTYALPTATDAVSGAVGVTCTPASGSTFAIGATTVTCRATDPSGNTATQTFRVTVVGPASQLVTLWTQVAMMPDLSGRGARALRSDLLGDLQNAYGRLTQSRPDVRGACSQMSAYLAAVLDPRNAQPRGPLSAADVAFLAGEGRRIQGAIGC